MVKSEPLIYYGYTNSTGDYSLLLGYDTTYTISAFPLPEWDIVNPDPLYFTAEVAKDGDTLSGYDFTLDYTTPVHDISVSVFQNAIIPGFESNASITIKNEGNQYDESGTVTLHYPSILSDPVTTPDYATHIDTILTWNYTDLDPYEIQTFYISYTADLLLTMIGEEVINHAEVTVDETDDDITNNNDSVYTVITGAFDPNHKTVSPEGEGEDGMISEATAYLTYTIQFQNTGTAETHFINIYDTLDTELDIESIEMLSASHNYELILTSPNIVRWKFDPVFLPDSASDLMGSMGYLTFRIKIKESATAGDIIENTAAIYFDFNPPVITNTTKNTLIIPDALENITADQLLFSIFPNPAVKYLTINLQKDTDKEMDLFITDVSGKLYMIDKIAAQTNSATLDISKLSSGTYECTITEKGQMQVKTLQFSVIK